MTDPLVDTIKVSWWFKVKAFFSHSRTVLVARLYGAAGILVAAHDYLLPFITGQDWTPITAKIPAWVLPVAGLVTNAVFEWLRHLTTQSLVDNKTDAIVAQIAPPIEPLPPTGLQP